MKCSACDNPFHPASGHRFTARTQLCGPCTRHMLEWVKAHTRRRSSGSDFYSSAATSIRADPPNTKEAAVKRLYAVYVTKSFDIMIAAENQEAAREQAERLAREESMNYEWDVQCPYHLSERELRDGYDERASEIALGNNPDDLTCLQVAVASESKD